MNLPNQFKQYLTTQGVSPNTLRNYLADLRNFAAWVEAQYQLKDEAVLAKLDSATATRYQAHLNSLALSASTINRRLSTLKKLKSFAQGKGLITPSQLETQPQAPSNNQKILLKEFEAELKKKHASPNTRKNYLSDVNHFLNWLGTN